MALEIGSIVDGKISGITSFGAFVSLPEELIGLVHISEIAYEYVKDVHDFIKIGDTVKVKILGINKQGKYDLSLKKVSPPTEERKTFVRRKERPEGRHQDPFEEKITAFLKQSEEKLLDHKKNLQRKQEGKKRIKSSG